MPQERQIRVRHSSETPPGGWVWKHPRGAVLKDLSFTALQTRAADFLLQEGEDPSGAGDQIHACTAKQCIAAGRPDLVEEVAPVRRSAAQYRSGAKAAFLRWWKESPVYPLIHGKAQRGEAVFVDQAEADRRAAICTGGTAPGSKCPRNVIPSGKGWLQAWSDDQMLGAVEGRRTAWHDRLGACEACSCELRAAVWWKPDILLASMRGSGILDQAPDFCWKRQLTQPQAKP